MVVKFICPTCKNSLKSKAIGWHKCKPTTVTCIHCSKEFKDVEYLGHTICPVEVEKAAGKDIPVNIRQSLWLDHVMYLSLKAEDPSVRQLLNRLVDFPSIPRSRLKFHNFSRFVFRDDYNESVVDKSFDALEAEVAKELVDGKDSGEDSGLNKKKKRRTKKRKAEGSAPSNVTETGIKPEPDSSQAPPEEPPTKMERKTENVV